MNIAVTLNHNFALDFTDVLEKSYNWGEKTAIYTASANKKINSICTTLLGRISYYNYQTDSGRDFPEFQWSSRDFTHRIPVPILAKIKEIFKEQFEITLEAFEEFDSTNIVNTLIPLESITTKATLVRGYSAKWSPNNPYLYKKEAPKHSPAKDDYTFKEHYQVFQDDLKREAFTDVVFLVGDKRFPAHRFWVSQYSEMLGAMMTNKMKESSTKEIPILEDDPKAFGMMMRFFYEATIPNNASLKEYYLLLNLADKYLVKPLTTKVQNCIESVISGVEIKKENFSEHFQLAQHYGSAVLLDKCFAFIRSSKDFDLVEEELTQENFMTLFKHLLGKRISPTDEPASKSQRLNPKEKKE